MSDKRVTSQRAAEGGRPQISQISGPRKDEFLRCVLRDVPHLDEELVTQVADHLSDAIDAVRADRSLIEQHLKPRFDPHAFSLMKVFRTSGESGLRERLHEIRESSHLQALARAQQISLPTTLRTDGADAARLKDAIVRGVISRYEDWQAAS
jgi:hypothetical protein